MLKLFWESLLSCFIKDILSAYHFKLALHASQYHVGEVHWSYYTESLITSMPYRWQHPADTKIQTAHFVKKMPSSAARTPNRYGWAALEGQYWPTPTKGFGIRLQRASEGQYWHMPTKGFRGIVLAYTYQGFHGASISKHLQRALQGQYWHTPTEGLRGPLSAYTY